MTAQGIVTEGVRQTTDITAPIGEAQSGEVLARELLEAQTRPLQSYSATEPLYPESVALRAVTAALALATPPKESPVEREAVARIAEVIAEDGGSWRACTGCQEGDDGHVSLRDYPYNDAFKCQPGGGCRECGGIGVLWETGDFYDGYAEFAAEQEMTRDTIIAELARLWVHNGQIEGQQSAADAILSMIRPAPTSEGEAVALREALEPIRVRELITLLDRKQETVHPTNRDRSLKLAIKLTYGDLTDIISALAALRTQDTSR